MPIWPHVMFGGPNMVGPENLNPVKPRLEIQLNRCYKIYPASFLCRAPWPKRIIFNSLLSPLHSSSSVLDFRPPTTIFDCFQPSPITFSCFKVRLFIIDISYLCFCIYDFLLRSSVLRLYIPLFWWVFDLCCEFNSWACIIFS